MSAAEHVEREVEDLVQAALRAAQALRGLSVVRLPAHVRDDVGQLIRCATRYSQARRNPWEPVAPAVEVVAGKGAAVEPDR